MKRSPRWWEDNLYIWKFISLEFPSEILRHRRIFQLYLLQLYLWWFCYTYLQGLQKGIQKKQKEKILLKPFWVFDEGLSSVKFLLSIFELLMNIFWRNWKKTKRKGLHVNCNADGSKEEDFHVSFFFPIWISKSAKQIHFMWFLMWHDIC